MQDQEDSFQTPEKIVKSFSVGSSSPPQPAFFVESGPLQAPIPVTKRSSKDQIFEAEDGLINFVPSTSVNLTTRYDIVKEIFNPAQPQNQPQFTLDMNELQESLQNN